MKFVERIKAKREIKNGIQRNSIKRSKPETVSVKRIRPEIATVNRNKPKRSNCNN